LLATWETRVYGSTSEERQQKALEDTAWIEKGLKASDASFIWQEDETIQLGHDTFITRRQGVLLEDPEHRFVQFDIMTHRYTSFVIRFFFDLRGKRLQDVERDSNFAYPNTDKLTIYTKVPGRGSTIIYRAPELDSEEAVSCGHWKVEMAPYTKPPTPWPSPVRMPALRAAEESGVAPAGGEAVEAAPAKKTCPACTFDNEPIAVRCGICDTKL
jgi:hypothetical protein